MEVNEPSKVLTIGHSTLALGQFLDLLNKSGVTAVADVRSSPFSRRSPHFSQNDLRASLREVGVKYVFLGRELGGRPLGEKLYCDGVADYEKMAGEPAFVKGIDRVIEGSKEHTIVLMCSEHDPLDCHRCLLVGRALANRGVTLYHILNNGKTASQHDIENRLLALSGSNKKDIDDMFSSREELLATAYRSRVKVVAYREPLQELANLREIYRTNHAS